MKTIFIFIQLVIQFANAVTTCNNVQNFFNDAECCDSKVGLTDIRKWNDFEASTVPINVLFLTGNERNCSLTFQPFVPYTFGPKKIRDLYNGFGKNHTEHTEYLMKNAAMDYRDTRDCIKTGLCREAMEYDTVEKKLLGRRVTKINEMPGVEVQSASFEELSAFEAETEQLGRSATWLLEVLHPESKNNPLFSLKNKLFWVVNLFPAGGLNPDGTLIPLPYAMFGIVIMSIDIRTGWRRFGLLNKQPGMPAFLVPVPGLVNPNFLQIDILDPRVKPDDIFGDLNLLESFCSSRTAQQPIVTGYEQPLDLRLRKEMNITQVGEDTNYEYVSVNYPEFV